jgi:hypothetical protein
VAADETPQHATSTQYSARAIGTVPSANGVILFSIDDVPVAMELLNATVIDLPEVSSIASVPFTLPAGMHTLTATYLGSEYYLPSSGSVDVTVERATTELEANVTSAKMYGSKMQVNVELTAPVQSGMASPSAAFEIRENGSPVPDVTWNANGVSVSGLLPGSHTLAVKFLGDDHYEPSEATVTAAVAKRVPSFESWSTVPSGTDRIEGPVTVDVKLSAPPDYGTTTGTVTFSIASQTFAMVPLDAEHHAAATTPLSAGTTFVRADYSGDANTESATRTVEVLVFLAAGTPIPLTATAGGSGSFVNLQWLPVADAISYQIYRRSTFAAQWVAAGSTSHFSTTLQLPIGTTRLYAVAPVYANTTIGPMGPPDLATNVAFTDAQVVPGTIVRAAHVDQLRTAVNAVRTFAGLPAFSFTDAIAAGTRIRALHLTQLRDALTEARNAIGMPMAFSPAAPAVGTPIRASHIEELRAGVR